MRFSYRGEKFVCSVIAVKPAFAMYLVLMLEGVEPVGVVSVSRGVVEKGEGEVKIVGGSLTGAMVWNAPDIKELALQVVIEKHKMVLAGYGDRVDATMWFPDWPSVMLYVIGPLDDTEPVVSVVAARSLEHKGEGFIYVVKKPYSDEILCPPDMPEERVRELMEDFIKITRG